MKYHIKLIKGRSYNGYGIKADMEHPDVYTDNEAIASSAVASGYFELTTSNITSNNSDDADKPKRTSNKKKPDG